jgi:DNA-binding transcriptional regulator YiaG
VKEGLPPVIKDLIRWRHRNGLSQRGASEVMQARGLDVKIGALKQWEQGMREPGSLAVKALRDFLTQHPRIENPPRYRPGPK